MGAAELLRGRRATTHWNSFHLLPWFGAIPQDARVVIDGNLISTAGVSAGIDGALRLAALLNGDEVAQRIQLDIQYAPEPPFAVVPPALLLPESALAAARLDAAKRAAEQLGSSGDTLPDWVLRMRMGATEVLGGSYSISRIYHR